LHYYFFIAFTFHLLLCELYFNTVGETFCLNFFYLKDFCLSELIISCVKLLFFQHLLLLEFNFFFCFCWNRIQFHFYKPKYLLGNQNGPRHQMLFFPKNKIVLINQNIKPWQVTTYKKLTQCAENRKRRRPQLSSNNQTHITNSSIIQKSNWKKVKLELEFTPFFVIH
jgi:hypothetical protein